MTRFIEGAIVPVERCRSRRRSAGSPGAPGRPRGRALAGRFDSFRIVEEYRSMAFREGRRAGGVRDGTPDRPPDRDARDRPRAAVPQRPAERELHRRRPRIRIVDWEYAGMGDCSSIWATSRSTTHSTRSPGRAARGLLRRAAACRRPGPRDDAVHVALPRGHVGRRPERGPALDFDFEAYAEEHFARLLERIADEDAFDGVGLGRNVRRHCRKSLKLFRRTPITSPCPRSLVGSS